MNISRIIKSASGNEPADLLLINCRIVNVFSGEIIPGNIAVKDGTIVGIGDYSARKTEDMKGRFVAPGLIDAHVHIESSMMCTGEFVKAVLGFGTTAVIADPHEIANVMGTEGIAYMLRSADHQPMEVFFALPSCVPATHMETSGAVITADDLAPFFTHPRVVALAEMMNYPGVIGTDDPVIQKLAMAKKFHKVLDGHSPGLSGKNLNAYIAAGISSDHECTSADEAREKLGAGMFIMIRESTGAKNLKDLLPMVNHKNFRRIMWCTDDRHPHDLSRLGHIDSMIREAVRWGLDPVMAIQMATINPADYFGLRDMGAIAPGRYANLIIFSELEKFIVEKVYVHGRGVAEDGRALPDVGNIAPEPVPNTMHVDPGRLDFAIPASCNRIHVIELVKNQIVTRHRIETAAIDREMAVSDVSRDILKCAVIERHKNTGNMGKGFGLKKGALASSVAHDSHNLIVVGVDDADMKTAALAVAARGGGLAVACGGKVLAGMALPLAGLMSTDPLDSVRRQLDGVLSAAESLGSGLPDPFMALSFLALPVIPEIKLTDKGLVDVNAFRIIPLFAP